METAVSTDIFGDDVQSPSLKIAIRASDDRERSWWAGGVFFTSDTAPPETL